RPGQREAGQDRWPDRGAAHDRPRAPARLRVDGGLHGGDVARHGAGDARRRCRTLRRSRRPAPHRPRPQPGPALPAWPRLAAQRGAVGLNRMFSRRTDAMTSRTLISLLLVAPLVVLPAGHAAAADFIVRHAVVVDGTGLVLAPGFIDTHSHHDRGLDSQLDALPVTSQGVTTIVVGQDGFSQE